MADLSLHEQQGKKSQGSNKGPYAENSKFGDHRDHRIVGKKSLEEVLSDPNEKLVTEHENRRGGETLVFENTKTGERQSFPNVKTDRLDNVEEK